MGDTRSGLPPDCTCPYPRAHPHWIWGPVEPYASKPQTLNEIWDGNFEAGQAACHDQDCQFAHPGRHWDQPCNAWVPELHEVKDWYKKPEATIDDEYEPFDKGLGYVCEYWVEEKEDSCYAPATWKRTEHDPDEDSDGDNNYLCAAHHEELSPNPTIATVVDVEPFWQTI